MNPLSRRQWLASIAAASATLALGACARRTEAKPNILWITCEDLSPVLGCYGDAYARTPHIDTLAKQALRYTNAYSSAPVCSPSRSCLLTGIPATALGTMHLRGILPLGESLRGYPAYLRDAGYYCTNNVKEDYNFAAPADTWDDSSRSAHWRNREPGQPFFAVFNIMDTHQGQVRCSQEEFERRNAALPEELRHDPADATLPPYYPDTELVRLNMAILHTQVTRMDAKLGAILQELETDGLAEDTIVFFYSDHGTGLPRGKRWLHDSGTRVPLLVRLPGRYRHFAPAAPGTSVDRLVSFEDFAPTVLSLAGVQVPQAMAGQPFLGSEVGAPRTLVFTARDRVDENIECSRAVFDGRFRYIRNYCPFRPRMQDSAYSANGLVRGEILRLAGEGKLQGDTAWLAAESVPAEELYDNEADPWELHNCAAQPAHRDTMARLRRELLAWMLRTRDTGLIPEDEMVRRSGGRSPYDALRTSFPFEGVIQAAERVGRGAGEFPAIAAGLKDEEPVVRYWSAVGLLALGNEAQPAVESLRAALDDPAPSVRITAAEALAKLGHAALAIPVLSNDVQERDARVALQAAVALWYLDDLARPAIPAMLSALKSPAAPKDQNDYLEWTLRKTLNRLGEPVERAKFPV